MDVVIGKYRELMFWQTLKKKQTNFNRGLCADCLVEMMMEGEYEVSKGD